MSANGVNANIMNASLVSVIIVVKNGERYLAEAIESVLVQTYEPFEIIVVDGQSTDNTEKITKSYKQVRYIRQTGQGIADAYNVGIDTAKGKLIAFISHDDLWASNKLSVQVNYLVSHPEIQYTVTKFKYFLEQGGYTPPGFKKELLGKEHVGRIMETLVTRKSLFDLIGKLNTDFTIANDVDWFTRAKDKNIPMATIPEVLLYKRIHNTNLSSNAQVNNQELLGILKQSISRRRNQQFTTE
jgi:glycosyltransferase involved in cell wall biosynthesis